MKLTVFIHLVLCVFFMFCEALCNIFFKKKDCLNKVTDVIGADILANVGVLILK